MAGIDDQDAEEYAKVSVEYPKEWLSVKYPKEWFSMLSSLTPDHHLVWDAGTGIGPAAISIAEYYNQVIATDVSLSQINHAAKHPKVRYIHTPISTSEDELVSILGGENSVDLIISAAAIHWFDLDFFYSVANRVLKKPNGIIAVWSYNYGIKQFERLMDEIKNLALPYADKGPLYGIEGYKNLPFPFESLGLGSEGNPRELEMEWEMKYDDFLGVLNKASAFVKAKEKGVDLLSEELLKKIEREWGDLDESKKLIFKAFMLVGKIKSP